jgi:hypothetical protein
MLALIVTIASAITGILLALWINSRGLSVYRVLYKTLYILACALIGLPVGLIWGLIEEPFKKRFTASRSARYAVYGRIWHVTSYASKASVSIVCSLPGLKQLLGIQRYTHRASTSWWSHSTLNPHTDMTCWRPFRTIARLYNRVYRSAQQRPYSVLRGLSLGMWIASKLPRF